MHLQENTIFDLWPWPWDQGHTKCCPVPSTSCDLFSYKVWSCYVEPLRRRYNYKKIQYLTFDLDLGVKVSRNVAQYPLHHVTYSTTKFEVATSNGLGGDTFTRNVTDGSTHGRTTDRLWHEINIPFFLKKKAGIMKLGNNDLHVECTQADKRWPFWWPPWLAFIGHKPYSNLSKRLIEVMHIWKLKETGWQMT